MKGISTSWPLSAVDAVRRPRWPRRPRLTSHTKSQVSVSGRVKPKRLHHVLVHVAGLGGAHVGHGVGVAVDGCTPAETGAQSPPGWGRRSAPRCPPGRSCGRRISRPAGTTTSVAGEVGGDVVRVGDAHVGGGAGGDVGDDVVVDVAVVGVQPQVHGDVGVQRLKVLNGLAGRCPSGVLLVSFFAQKVIS